MRWLQPKRTYEIALVAPLSLHHANVTESGNLRGRKVTHTKELRVKRVGRSVKSLRAANKTYLSISLLFFPLSSFASLILSSCLHLKCSCRHGVRELLDCRCTQCNLTAGPPAGKPVYCSIHVSTNRLHVSTISLHVSSF